MKCSSICDCDSSSQILFSDSTACTCQSNNWDGGALDAHLLPDKRLLYRGKVFEGGEEHMGVLWPSNKVDKLAQFLAQGSEHLVFILDRLCTRR